MFHRHIEVYLYYLTSVRSRTIGICIFLCIQTYYKQTIMLLVFEGSSVEMGEQKKKKKLFGFGVKEIKSSYFITQDFDIRKVQTCKLCQLFASCELGVGRFRNTQLVLGDTICDGVYEC